jgi:phosphate transport system substrate-binding protein
MRTLRACLHQQPGAGYSGIIRHLPFSGLSGMRILKPLLFLALLVLLLWLGGILSLVMLFMGQAYWLWLMWPAVLCLLLLAGSGLFGWLSPRWRRGVRLALLGCTVIAGGIAAYQAWDDSFRTVADEVELSQYRPFEGEARLARLPAPASLRLDGDLPRLDGATALYPLYAAFVQAVYPQDSYWPGKDPVRCSKTPEAWQRLIDGEADLIFVARPSQKQLEAAKAAGVEFVMTPIGREAFVFFVNARNPVRGLSVSQIQAIYSGELTDWRDAGGEAGRIKAFQRPEGSGSQTMLQKIMAGKTLLPAPQADVVQGMGGIIRRAADYKNYRNAIGYSFLFFATGMLRDEEIRLLEIDGVAPGHASIRDGSYPFAADFYAVSVQGRETSASRALVEWILSAEGQALVAATGYVPRGER